MAPISTGPLPERSQYFSGGYDPFALTILHMHGNTGALMKHPRQATGVVASSGCFHRGIVQPASLVQQVLWHHTYPPPSSGPKLDFYRIIIWCIVMVFFIKCDVLFHSHGFLVHFLLIVAPFSSCCISRLD